MLHMNNNVPELIVMLTYNDRTVNNAYDVFSKCKDTKVKYWGMKEEGLPLNQMKELYKYMKQCGKTTVLEVVAYSENDCMDGARIAAECECEILMGTLYFESVNKFCKENNIKYMPFVGNVGARPSVLKGSAEEMIREAKYCLENGVYGIDLLGYRYCGDATTLIEEFVENVKTNVCVAGSVDSFKKLDDIKRIQPWSYTIGSAFFENKFGGTVKEQIEKVCSYMENISKEGVVIV